MRSAVRGCARNRPRGRPCHRQSALEISVTARNHYSYTVYADPVTAASFDERRFGGPIGQLIAVEQARVLAEFAGPIEGRSILDVGTGTGRAAIVMARAG